MDADSTAENKYAAAIGKSAAELDSYIATINLHNSALGAGATVTDIVTAKMAVLAKQQQQGAGLTKDQLDNSQRLIQAQADGTYAIQGQINATNVNIGAMGRSAGAAEEYRIIQTATNKALQDGKDPATEISAAFRGLAHDAGTAAQSYAALQIAAQIKFDRQTAFLTPEDVQIAQKLAGLYGNDIPAALGSTEAAALRANAQLKAIKGVKATAKEKPRAANSNSKIQEDDSEFGFSVTPARRGSYDGGRRRLSA